MLVEELVADRFFGDGRREHPLVFRERLFGDERSRKVEIAERPSPLHAERAYVIDHPHDFRLGQLVPEGRHDPVECSRRTALMDNRQPIEIGLWGRQAAVREVRRIDVEAANRDGLATPVAAMTGRARSLVNLLPAPPASVDRLRVEAYSEHEQRQGEGRAAHRFFCDATRRFEKSET